MDKEKFEEEIAALTMRRERTKLELFEKEALRTSRYERFIKYGEETPFNERLELDSEIAALVVDRQSSKIRLMQLKASAKAQRRETYVGILNRRLRELGMEHLIDEARAQADADLEASGLMGAYATN